MARWWIELGIWEMPTGDTSAQETDKTVETTYAMGADGLMHGFIPNKDAVPEWVATEIKQTWNEARAKGWEMEAFRILETMVDRLGYGRTENNPPLWLKKQP
jgi:hypothetical protein